MTMTEPKWESFVFRKNAYLSNRGGGTLDLDDQD